MEKIVSDILNTDANDYVKSVMLEGMMDLNNWEKWWDDEEVEEWGEFGEWMNVLLCEDLIDWFDSHLLNNIVNNEEFDTSNYLNGLEEEELKQILEMIEEWELEGNIIGVDGGPIADGLYNWFGDLSPDSKIFIIQKVLRHFNKI